MRWGVWLILLSILATGCEERRLETVLRNNRGVEAFLDEKYKTAHQSFVHAATEAPGDQHIRFNLGASFEAIEQSDQALKEYNLILKESQDERILFRTHYNKARLLAQQKQIDAALEEYQKALAILPHSKEVKHNIELLIQDPSGGQGGGEGEPQENQDGDGDSDNQNPNQGPPKEQEQKQKPFNSEDLTQQDVQRILEELKRQEQKIRAKDMGEKGQESSGGKDW